MSDQEDDRNHLACPKCKSTNLGFEGLRNNMVDTGREERVVSGSFRWKFKKCGHEFEITIPN
jgi:hypothetical protein